MNIDQLHKKARQAIGSGEMGFRTGADYLAEARKLGATQRESASAIGKSPAWVNALLKWHDGGFKSDAPFPGATRSPVQRAEQKNGDQKRASRPATTAEQAQAQTAKANAQHAKAEAQKARADAAKVRAEANKARAEAKRAQQEAFSGMFSGMFGHREKKKIHSGARELLIKALGMLGSEHSGERASAALVVEKQRARLGMTWDELIVPAESQVEMRPHEAAGVH
jgi:multidrug efflux pump subunit AcrA (membrane-fusion protein)